MADINQVQLPDGSQFNIKDDISGYASEAYVQSQISGITKATIGLGNVDNTSDANKPVSTAQQTALNGKTNTSVIAYTESSATATKRYEVGDQFILSGVLYTATAIIPNGYPITIGTNCSASDALITQIDTVKSGLTTAQSDISTLSTNKANKSDLASISITGTTNSTGSTISEGTYFYLNGTLVRAKTDIASGATFTLNTNYEVVSAGGLNEVARKVRSLSCGATTTTSISEIPLGAFVAIARDSAGVKGFYMVDNSATVVPLISASGVTVTFTNYSLSTGGTLNFANGTASGFFATIVCP